MFEPKQYEIFIASEYVPDLLNELSSVLHIPVSPEVIRKNVIHSGDNDDQQQGKAVVFYNNTKESFILVDCYIKNPTDYIYFMDIIVRCTDNLQNVQSILLRWHNLFWKKYNPLNIKTRLINKYESSTSMLHDIYQDRILIEVK